MNLLFPTIRIEKPSRELLQAYNYILKPPETKKAIPLLLGLCAFTTIVPFLAIGSTPLTVLYISPTLLLAAIFVYAIFSLRLSGINGLLGFIALENLFLVIAPTMLLYPHQSDDQMIFLYALLLLSNFLWILVLYRLRYKKFGSIVQSRIHNLHYPRKRPWAGFLGIVSLTVLTRLIIKTFSIWVIGLGGVIMIGYCLNPLITEQLVIVRQYNQMEPHLQEYAGEENEPEV